MKSYKLFSTLLTCIIVLFVGGQSIFASQYFPNGKGEIPEGAKEFAKTHFKEQVVQTLKDDVAENYKMTEDTSNITFGNLIPTFSMTREFKKSESDIKEQHKGLIQKNEWISVVYQDEKPVNVIGTFQNDEGAYELSTFGYGNDLAVALDALKLKPNTKVFYEMPQDAWYVYQDGKISGLNGAAKNIIPKAVSEKKFRKDIIDRYKDAKPLYEKGQDTSVGSSGGASNMLEEPKRSMSPFVMYGGAGLIVSLIGTAFLIFQHRRKVER